MAAIPVEWLWFPNYPRATHELLASELLDPIEGGGGWIPTSLCLHAVPGSVEPRFTSVWLRWPNGLGQPPIRHLALGDAISVADWLETQAAQGYYPFLVSAAGVPPDTRFSVFVSSVGRPAHPELDAGRPVRPSIVALEMRPFAADFSDVVDYYLASGWYPQWIAPYGLFPGQGYVAVVWREQPSRGGPNSLNNPNPLYSDGWVQRGINVAEGYDGKAVSRTLESGFAFPRVLGLVEDVSGTQPRPLRLPQQVMLHGDVEIDGIGHEMHVPASAIQQTIDDLASSQLWPLSIMGSGFDEWQRFNIVYATAGHIDEPKRQLFIERLTSSGLPSPDASPPPPAPPGRYASIDQFGVGLRRGATDPYSAGHLVVRATPGRPIRPRTSPAIGRAPDALLTATEPATFISGGEVITFGSQVPEPSAQVELTPAAAGDFVVNPNLAKFAAVDDFVEQILRRHSARAAQIAVGYQGQLKYAAAYTLAPPSYPKTRIAQRMRLGSVSKVLASMALVRLAEGGVGNTADANPIDLFTANMASLLGASATSDPNTRLLFASRTPAQLACHVGYFESDLILPSYLDPWVISRRFYGTSVDEVVPLPTDLLLRYVLETYPPIADAAGWFQARPAGALSTDPALQPTGEYSNFGFLRLGDVIEQQNAGGRPYLEYLRDLILRPLGIPVGRIERTVTRAIEAAANTNEVRYHARVPAFAGSVQAGSVDEDTGEIGPAGFGVFHYDATAWQLGESSGFLALAALDVVRVLSSFDLAYPHPLFERRESIDALIAETYATARTLGFFRAKTLFEGTEYLMHSGLHVGNASVAFRRGDSLVAVLTINNDIHSNGAGDAGDEGGLVLPA